MKRTWKVLAVSLLLSAGFATCACAGWEQDGEGRYSYKMDSGAYARDQIIEIDGARYAFDQAAHMLTGWNVVDGEWHYFDASGAMAAGWLNLDGSWYYLDPSNGAMKSGKFNIGSNIYLTDSSGVLQVNGWYGGPDGYMYRTDENGVIKRNGSEEDDKGNIYVYDDDGRIRVANTSTRNTAKAEGGSFLSEEYLSKEKYDEWRDNIVNRADEAIGGLKDDLYDEYREAMEEATTSKKRASRRKKWERRATNQLTKVSMTEEEIKAYIKQVENDTYVYSYGDYPDDDFDFDSYYDDDDDDYDDDDD